VWTDHNLRCNTDRCRTDRYFEPSDKSSPAANRKSLRCRRIASMGYEPVVQKAANCSSAVKADLVDRALVCEFDRDHRFLADPALLLGRLRPSGHEGAGLPIDISVFIEVRETHLAQFAFAEVRRTQDGLDLVGRSNNANAASSAIAAPAKNRSRLRVTITHPWRIVAWTADNMRCNTRSMGMDKIFSNPRDAGFGLRLAC